MKRFARLSLLVALVLLTPLMAHGQTPQTETMTAQIDLTTPAGTTFMGTVVGMRTGSVDNVQTSWTFTGTINGKPASASGTAAEHWLGDGKEDIELLSITTWAMPIPQPPLGTVHAEQAASGLISVMGIPMAIGGKLEAPFSGRQLYAISNPGAGSQPIASLPNTAGAASVLFNPVAITATFITIGALLMLASRRLCDPQGS